MRQPSCAGWMRPVCQRHKSTASCRATATIARFRAEDMLWVFSKMCFHFWIKPHRGWYCTSRQASVTSEERSRGLPHLLIESIFRDLPLLETPEHNPV